MSNTIVSNFGNYNPIDPAVIAYVNAAIATANADAVQASPPSIANAIAQYADTTGKLIKSTPYTMPDTLGVAGQVLEVDAGGNIVYGAGGGVPPTYLPTLTVTNLSQGPNALSTNYTLPTYPPAIDTILGNNGAQGFVVNIPATINCQFFATYSNPLRLSTINIPIPAGDYIPDDLTNIISVAIRDSLATNNIIANIFIGFDPLIQRYGMRLSPGSVDFTSMTWQIYVNGTNNNNVFGLTTGNATVNPAAPGIVYGPDAPLYLNATGELVWRSVLSNQITSDNGNSVIECSELSGIISYGDYNVNNGSINNCGNINALDNCNITTNTTQIVNGLSELNINIDSLPRMTQNAIKTKLECGVSSLQLAAVSDGTSQDTTTYIGASNVGNTENTVSIYLPNDYQVIQNNGAIQRIVVDNDTTALYSKNATSGPAGSLLQLNNDNTFTLGCYFANNGIIECRPNSLALYGNTATSAITMTDLNIITSLGVGGRIDREILDTTSQSFRDPTGTERLKIDNTGVIVNGDYTLPLIDGSVNQVLTTSGAGITSWQTPQLYGLYSQTGTATVANTVVETTLIGSGVGSLSVPANYFTTGMAFRYNTGGTFRDNANNTTFRFRLRNGGILFDSGNLTLPLITVVSAWNIDVTFTYVGGTTIITNFNFQYNNGSDARGFTSQNTNNTLNTTIPNTLNFTVQWGAASANNTITTNFGVLQKIY